MPAFFQEKHQCTETRAQQLAALHAALSWREPTAVRVSGFGPGQEAEHLKREFRSKQSQPASLAVQAHRLPDSSKL